MTPDKACSAGCRGSENRKSQRAGATRGRCNERQARRINRRSERTPARRPCFAGGVPVLAYDRPPCNAPGRVLETQDLLRPPLGEWSGEQGRIRRGRSPSMRRAGNLGLAMVEPGFRESWDASQSSLPWSRHELLSMRMPLPTVTLPSQPRRRLERRSQGPGQRTA